MNLNNASLFSMSVYNDLEVGETGPYGSTVIRSVVSGDFAAVAFYVASTNEVVVAYRGTDDQEGEFGDKLTGWPIGIGLYGLPETQADKAFAFYNDVLADIADPAHPAHVASTASISFTGHSLGGGLAGLVSSFAGKPAFVFDSMPFTDAATNLHADVTGPDAANFSYWSALAFPDGQPHEPSFSLVQAASMAGESLAGLRYGMSVTITAVGVVISSGHDAQIIVQNEFYGGTVSNPENLHSMGLLAIALHGGLQHSEDEKAGADAFYQYLFDASFASGLGFASTTALQDALAYSLSEGTSSLDSFFSDMTIIGNMLRTGFSPYVDALARMSITQAVHVATEEGNLRSGLIEVASGYANIALTGVHDAEAMVLDLLQYSNGAFGGATFDVPLSGYANLAVELSGYGSEVHLGPGGTLYFGSLYDDDIYGSASADYIVSLGSDSQFSDTIRGGGGNDTILASSGNDRVYGGSDNDVIYGGAGSDILYGDAGADRVHIEGGASSDVDYVNGGADTDTLLVHIAATYHFDVVGVAGVLANLPPSAVPVSAGAFALTSGQGAAYVQQVENLEAADAVNELKILSFAQMNATGLKFLDFTAGNEDTAQFTGSAVTNFVLKGELGQSIVSDGGANSAKVAGVDTWNLTSGNDTVTIYQTHVGTQMVHIYGMGGNEDTAIFNGFSTALEFRDGEEVGNTGVTLHGFEKIVGGSGDNIFHGTPGRDIFYGGSGVTTVYGSLGNDLVSTNGALILDYSASASAVFFTRNGPLYQGGGAVTSMSYGDQFFVQAGAKITIHGSNSEDTLSLGVNWGELNSGGGNDTLIGGSGNDRFIGADGYAETITPGDGIDEIDFKTGGGTLNFGTTTIAGVINLATRSFVFGTQTDTVLGSFEKLVGTAKGDTIDGTEQRDVIDGGGGYDIIYGFGGNDDITLSAGIVHGGSGEDTIKVTGKNVLAFGGDDRDTFSTITNAGWAAGSMLYGEGGDDVFNVRDLYGRTIQGLTLIGGEGADEFNGGQYATSVISYNSSASGVTLIRAANGVITATGGDAQGDKISGAFSIQGSECGDHIVSAWGSDGYVHGGGGADFLSGGGTIYGDSGADTITSAAGSHSIYLGVDNDIDTFVFSRLAGFDKIYDFTSIDVIEIGAGYKYDDFGDILANSQQVGNNVDIWFESNMTLTIMNYSLSSLTAGNFDFT